MSPNLYFELKGNMFLPPNQNYQNSTVHVLVTVIVTPAKDLAPKTKDTRVTGERGNYKIISNKMFLFTDVTFRKELVET